MIFTIPGEPQGKKRPRFNRKTGVTYTPSETVEYEKKVKAMFYAQGGKMMPEMKKVLTDKYPHEVPVAYKVEIWAFMAPPKSYPQWKKELMLFGTMLPTKKPDLDNIGKIILDGLNKVAWKDDSAVADLTVHKRYDGTPRVVVEIREI